MSRWIARVLSAAASLCAALAFALVYTSAGAATPPAPASTQKAAIDPRTLDARLLDDFRDLSAWQAKGSDQVKATTERGPAGGICLRYEFQGVAGYAVLRRALPIALPPRYAFVLRVSGDGPANAFQFKLTDAGGDNVWWMNRPVFEAPKQATDLLIRQRQITFAWGPTEDRTLKNAAAVELVIASGPGGKGRLCFERLSLRTLPEPGPDVPPVASASSASDSAAHAVDGNGDTAWQSAAGGVQRWQVDFGSPKELSGVLLRWRDGERASDFDLDASVDGKRWRRLREVRGSERDVLPLWLPDEETRFLRLTLRRGPQPRYALAEFESKSPLDWPGPNAALGALAKTLPRGAMPRAFVGEQNYWTVVGTDSGGATAALLSEDGAIEPRKGGPSIEPAVIDEDSGNAVRTWADVKTEHSLRDGYLPLPQVRWLGDGYTLAIDAGADGDRTRSELVVRYTLTNTSDRARHLSLALALRPWQVNPPTQFLNTPGGVSPVGQVAWQKDTLAADGRDVMQALTPPDAVGAAGFDRGDAVALAAQGRLPALKTLDDPQQWASAVLRWRAELAPGASRRIDVVLPLAGALRPPADADARWADARLDAVAGAWRERLNRVTLSLPPSAAPLVNTLRSALAQILMSRDGPALQPGTRSYARSWIRDGAMMVAGLLRLGETETARSFVQWYAGHLFANGKVPCCVDGRGADPVAENDSPGEFIYAVAELWRSTHDKALVEPLWAKVDAAARYMEELRQSERSAANREPGREAFFGLMPASISHEGYSAKPMHSYWDDFWALAGYRDAARLAAVMGLDNRAAELRAQGDEFGRELGASIAAAVAKAHIDFLPGAAELGDFDPSSSTMVFSPAGAENLVPNALLKATWSRYWRESVERRDGKRAWTDYTPYELRSVSALLRLGEPAQARAMLDFFMNDRRPAGWNQWAEVVGRDPREPRFLGDMPHAWVSSDYIRSVLDLFAYTRDSDEAMVLAAGVPDDWWRASPMAVTGLSTPWGTLNYRLSHDGPTSAGVLHVEVDSGLNTPPGGLWLAWPAAKAPLPDRSTDGAALEWKGRLLKLPPGRIDVSLPLAAPGEPLAP